VQQYHSRITNYRSSSIIHYYLQLMCEFCSFGPNSNRQDRDASDPFNFGGFFSADAINEAVRLSKQQQQQQRRDDGGAKEEGDGEEDDDGT
jgi:hypothetical protein